MKAIEKMQKLQNQGNQENINDDKSLSTVETTVETEDKEEEGREPGTSHQLLLEYMHLDLNSLSSTVQFVEAFKKTGYPLHVLICNAGIAFANQGWFIHVSNMIKLFERFP